MITVAGLTPSVDVTYVVDSLRLGAIHRPTSVVRCAGGKPLNLARAAAALGADVAVVGHLGGQTGTWLVEELEQAGVTVAVVEAAAATRTCVSIASTDRSDLTEVYEYAEPIPAAEWELFSRALETRLVERPGWLAISGGPPRGFDRNALADLARSAHAIGARVAVDTHGPSLGPLVDQRPELVKINRFEAAELVGLEATLPLDTLAAAVRKRSAGIVVLTDGAAGAFALTGEAATPVRPPEMRGHFPVGSGDCFLGGLLTGLDDGAALPDALRLASGAATANALVPGPGRFDADLALRLAEQAR